MTVFVQFGKCFLNKESPNLSESAPFLSHWAQVIQWLTSFSLLLLNTPAFPRMLSTPRRARPHNASEGDGVDNLPVKRPFTEFATLTTTYSKGEMICLSPPVTPSGKSNNERGSRRRAPCMGEAPLTRRNIRQGKGPSHLQVPDHTPTRILPQSPDTFRHRHPSP
jgi:hypothetical protein